MIRTFPRPPQRRLALAAPGLGHPRSGGAVIIIVLTLLATLTFLGFFYYEWTDQEQKAARAFAGVEDAELPVDRLFDQGFEQLIVGTRAEYPDSSLWGGLSSLLAHVLGPVDSQLRPERDRPFNAPGIAFSFFDANGDGVYSYDQDGDGAFTDPEIFRLDYNGDGILDATSDFANDPYNTDSDPANDLRPITFNYSRKAQLFDNTFDAFNQPDIGPFAESLPEFATDAGYTYPDWNALFLSYEADLAGIPAIPGVSADGRRRVLIPSFFRPQMSPQRRDVDGDLEGGDTVDVVGGGEAGFADFFISADTTLQSLRPHYLHRVAAANSGTPDTDGPLPRTSGDDNFRYLRTPTQAQSGDTNRIIPAFPFLVDVDGDGIAGEMGALTDINAAAWTNPSTGAATAPLYELDVDNDGDGVRDSIWIDLGLPPINLPDGRQVVPLFAFKVLDGDALLNVNVHGSLAWLDQGAVAPLLVDWDGDGTFDPSEDTNGNGRLDPLEDTDGDGYLDPADVALPATPFRSNLGLSPAEVNLAYALFSNPTVPALSPSMLQSLPPHAGLPSHLRGPFDSAALTGGPVGSSSAELLCLLSGRPSPGTGTFLPGRYGEIGQGLQYFAAQQSQPPRAGLTFIDDDSDRNSSGGLGVITVGDPQVNNIDIPPAVHPLDFLGVGGDYLTLPSGPAKGAARTLGQPLAGNPSQWVDYTGGFDWQDPTIYAAGLVPPYTPGGLYGVLPWVEALTAGLQAAGFDGLQDEDNEQTAHPWLQSGADELFEPQEMAGLHLSPSDFVRTSERSRLRDLAQFSLRDAPDASINRSMLTTDSWDRRELAHGVVPNEPDLDGDGMFDAGEFDADDDGAFGPEDDRDGDGAYGSVFVRGAEFNAWGLTAGTSDLTATYPAGFAYFPPRFPLITPGEDVNLPFKTLVGGTSDPDQAALDSTDPVRWELRRLLNSRIPLSGAADVALGAGRTQPQQRLNLNRLLAGFDNAGNPVYRHLTPHPDFQPGDSVTIPNIYHGQHSALGAPEPPAGSPALPFSSIDPATAAGRTAQEWWARYDRQRMARDIFALLWITGGGNDLNDYTRDLDDDSLGADHVEYTPERVREMAQFAVNTVDALDRDDVITRFEYDEDFTDGWDNPDQAVYGVESQQLTFGEVMWIYEPAQTSDLARTLHVDDDTNHQWLYIELRNTSPFPVDLDTDTWRLVRVSTDDPVGASDANVDASVEFQASAGVVKTIGAGENFVVACHDGFVENSSGQVIPADFYADYQAGSEFESIVPNSTATVANGTIVPLPQVDLDLSTTDMNHVGFYTVTLPYTPMNASENGTALVGRDDALAAGGGFDLVLQRRVNLFAYGNGQQVPPGGMGAELWVEVDRFQLPAIAAGAEFNPTGDSQTAMLQQFDGSAMGGQAIVSQERPEPFDPVRQTPHAGGAIRNHSLRPLSDASRHQANDTLTAAGATTFSLWEPHFNRDFSSAIELLSIPLYGHQGSTGAPIDTLPFNANVQNIGGAVGGLAADSGGVPRMVGHRTAAARMLYPGPTAPTEWAALQTGAEPHYRNRWYRLLEFVEVPDRSEESADPLVQWRRRTPGKINRNTLRHEHVLAGLLDDPSHMDLTVAANQYEPTEDALLGRNWFDALRASRDGADPLMAEHDTTHTAMGDPEVFTNVGQVTIPGSPGLAQPFRPQAFSQDDPVRLDPTSMPPVAPDRRSLVDQALARDENISATMLRDIARTAGGLKHGLFEARTFDDLTGQDAGNDDTIDYHTRNRLLAKIHNRTTNRSHVFAVWTTIGFFEAHQLAANGQVQIGGEVQDLPRRRAFIVCDMSRLEEAYSDPFPEDPASVGQFDFRKFVIYRKLLQ